MGRYVLGRVAFSVLLFVAITLFVFVGFSVLPKPEPRPGAPVQDLYRLHGSMGGQYVHYVWHFVRYGDLGRSYSNRDAVSRRLFRALPVTLTLVLGGLLVWLLIAIPVGMLAALRPRSALDRASTLILLIGISVHPLWLGLVLGWVFGTSLHVLPAAGYCDLFTPSTECGGPAQWIDHMLLPWFAFGILNVALYMLMVRAVVHDELGQDYVRTARAKGATEMRVMRSHILKNAMLPILTMIGMNVGLALAGVVFIESAFGLPGLGGTFRQAILRRDVPMTAGIVLFVTLAIMVLNLLVDLAYAVIDPRVRISARTATA